MRVVRMATWTSGEPVSVSARRYSPISADFESFVNVMSGKGSRPTEPSAAPVASRTAQVAAHVAGFFLPWAAYGLAAFAALRGIEHLVDASPGVAKWLGVAIFAAAGAYQLSPWKHACMAHCRMRMPGAADGVGRALATGVRHGVYCVGCCWALMTVLFAVGIMNVPAMIGLTAVIFLEKLWARGPLLARAAGVAFLVMAVVAAV